MARSALYALVAVASFTYVAGQTTAIPTFPATPLDEISFAYSSLVCVLLLRSIFFGRILQLIVALIPFSRTKFTPPRIHTFVGLRLATISAILPPQTSSLCARLG